MLRIGPLELGDSQMDVHDIVRELGDLNARMSELFPITASSADHYNLQKLASNGSGRFQMTHGLRRELYHLHGIGYVEVDFLFSLASEGPSLLAYVHATETGRSSVALRRDPEGAQGVVARHDARAGAEQPAMNASGAAHHGSGLEDVSL